MRHKNHKRIEELKKRAAPIAFSEISVNEFGELDYKESLDKRIIKGYACIWGKRNLHGEKFVKGAFTKSIKEHGPDTASSYKIKFLNQHKQDEACSLLEVLREDDTGLYFETKPLDPVPWADNLLVQLRSGTINNFSFGFDHVWSKVEWDDEDDSLVVLEAILFELSSATIPSGLDTYMVRSMEEEVEVNNQIKDFISTLPKEHRLNARKIFALQRSLYVFGKPGQPLFEEEKPTTEQRNSQTVNFSYLLENLNLFKQ